MHPTQYREGHNSLSAALAFWGLVRVVVKYGLTAIEARSRLEDGHVGPLKRGEKFRR